MHRVFLICSHTIHTFIFNFKQKSSAFSDVNTEQPVTFVNMRSSKAINDFKKDKKQLITNFECRKKHVSAGLLPNSLRHRKQNVESYLPYQLKKPSRMLETFF